MSRSLRVEAIPSVQFLVVEADVRSLIVITATTVTRLASHVEPIGTTPNQ